MRFATVTEGKLLPVVKGHPWKYLDGSPGGLFASAQSVPVAGKADAHNGQWVVEANTGGPYADLKPRPTLVLVESAAALVDAPLDTTPYDAAAVKAAADKAVTAALDHVAPAIAAVQTAITEARPR